MRTTDTDPMSNQRLLNSSLTPVFVLKSRSLEYRESTSRACIDRACSVSPPRPPIDYLRRAVELCSDAGFLPKGLTSDVVTYVTSHLSNVYDRLALDLFARSLASHGYRDRAAAVYFHLLVTEDDKTAQADLLKRCLACWQAADTPFNSGADASASRNNISSHVDSHVYEKLIQMVDTTGAQFGWLIEVSSGAGLGNTFLAQLCEHILFPQRALLASPSNPNFLSSSSSSPPSSSSLVALSGGGRSNAKRLPGSLPWETEKEVLLKYCFVLTTAVKEENTKMDTKVKCLEEKMMYHTGKGSVATRRGRFLNKKWGINSSFNSTEEENEEDNGSGGSGHPLGTALCVFQRAVRHPLVMVPCAILAAFGDPHNPLVRSMGVLPFIALMSTQNLGGRQSGGDGDGGGGSDRQLLSSVTPESSPLVEGTVNERSRAGNSGSDDEGIDSPKS